MTGMVRGFGLGLMVMPAPAGVNGRGRAISAGLAAVIVRRYTAGESGEKIAQDRGLGRGRLCKLLREHGVLRTR